MKDRKTKQRNIKYSHVAPEMSHQLLADEHTLHQTAQSQLMLAKLFVYEVHPYMNYRKGIWVAWLSLMARGTRKCQNIALGYYLLTESTYTCLHCECWKFLVLVAAGCIQSLFSVSCHQAPHNPQPHTCIHSCPVSFLHYASFTRSCKICC